MNKDAILASVIGFGIGLLITGGILLGPTLINQVAIWQQSSGEVASATQSSAETELPKDAPDEDTPVTIESPASETIASSEKITVSGKSYPENYVIIAGDLDETVSTAIQGIYSGEITLKEGVNTISVTSVGKKNSTSQRIVVYYTP